jgi:hypothetical protein
MHVPALAYAASIEMVGWVCPLTPLEQRLRIAAGQAGYEGSFVEHYVGGVVYPAGWDAIHVWLAVLLVTFNVAVYAFIVWKRKRRPAG